MDFDFTTETITPDATNVLTIGGTGALEFPVGTTLERPLSVIAGALRWNTTDSGFEYFNGTSWQAFGSGGGSGTVTSVSATGSTGLTVGGSPITTSGTLTFTLDTGLQNLATFNTTGVLVATGTDTWASRTLVAPAAGITISNANGVAGNPTFALANDLAAVEGLTTTGFAVRTATDTWATRTILGTTNQITVTNGTGVSADPVIAIATNPIIPGTGSIQIPSGTTAERSSPASNGMMRYNTTSNNYEVWVVDHWENLALFTPGGTFQLNAYLGSIPSSSGTSTVPYDNTEPLITEGTEIWTRTVVPSSADSRYVVECPFTVDLGTSNRVLIVSIFRDSVNLGTALFWSTGGGRPITLSMKVNDNPATTSPITFSMRAGVGAGAATWYINATASGQTLGGKLVSQYEIREFSS